MIRQLPAGLLGAGVEFFRDPVDLEKAYGVASRQVLRINDLPATLKQEIDADILAFPVKGAMLSAMGYHTPDTRREKYIGCGFAAFDSQPDYINGVFYHLEYSPCPVSDSCPGHGILCNPLRVGSQGKILTPREIQIFKLVGLGWLNKEIAASLGISEQTVKIHITNIQAKAELDNKKDLIILAYQKNLLS
jgi:DNA-binding CsgD family transcriptional regulator